MLFIRVDFEYIDLLFTSETPDNGCWIYEGMRY